MATIAFTEDLWQELVAQLAKPFESAGIVLAGFAEGDDPTLLARRVIWVPPEAYAEQSEWSMKIRSTGYVPALKSARFDSSVPIFFHTHPKGAPEPSSHDEEVDRQLADLFRSRSGRDIYVSLIVGGFPDSPSFTGRLDRERGRSEPIARLRVVGGRRWSFVPGHDHARGHELKNSDRFDRQVRAFGHEGQVVLESLRVGVVGAGGTGSAVCEQLLRLGVGSLVVIDDDLVDKSNLTRIHESGQKDLGRPKVELVVIEANRIASPTRVVPVKGNVASPSVARRLTNCDVIFGCTDDNAGRAVMSRLAYWYLTPLIDLGFAVRSVDGVIKGLFGRVTTVVPGEACLICRGRLDPAGIRNDLLSPEERKRLAGEGYAPELGERQPSVITFTTLVASFGINELFMRLYGYGPSELGSELLIRLNELDLSQNRVAPRPDHYCADRENWGRGDEDPLLSQMWP